MFEKYDLPYAFDALEPTIDALTMETHSTKHHAAYTNTLNAAMENVTIFGDDEPCIICLQKRLAEIDDEALRTTVRNNAGGFYNHNLYFSILSPDAKAAPTGELAEKIDAAFGSLDALKEALNKAGAARFGSGWAWLSVTADGDLVVSSSPNQDNPIIEGTGNTPILGIDVWEHAYYLKYRNLRPKYLEEIWNVIDWAKVEENYANAVK